MMKRPRDDVFPSSKSEAPANRSPAHRSRETWMSAPSSAQWPTTTDALLYLEIVKERFQDRRDKYAEFLEVMKEFKAARIDPSGIILKVKELFEGDPDLISGFNAFLPKGYKITLMSDDEPGPEKKAVDFKDALGFIRKIKRRFQDGDHVYNTFLDMLHMHFRENKPVTETNAKVSDLFKDHPDLQVEFTQFLPAPSRAASVQCAEPGRNLILSQDVRDSPLIMTRHIHIEKKPTASCAFRDKYVDQPHSEQWNIVKKEQEKGVDEYKNERQHDDSLGKRSKSLCRDDSVTDLFPQGCSQNNKQIFSSLKEEEREGGENNREDRDTNGDHDERERDRCERGLAFNIKEVQGLKLSATEAKFMKKPIQELDLSNCDRCTPSYRLLPDNYPVPSVSYRTKLDDEVLNDRWVSVTSGSEDYSFKHMRRNQYEESLFRCEDDRSELDMLLESVNATVKRVEVLLDNIDALTNKTNTSLHIEDHLSALNLRCIERLYGDHGLELIEALRTKALFVLPVILTRLKQKQLEWASCRSDFNKIWAEVYAKNYHKSLDYRSFYFKQQDTKNLSAKALLAEIKEMSGEDQNDEEMVCSVGARYRQPIIPHMKFDYTDPEIQQDLYQLMKYSCEEVCTPEQRDRVMKIWTTFLEPFLGLPSHLSAVDVEPQEGVTRIQSLSSTEVTEAQKYPEQIGGSSESELEEGELAPSRDLEEKNLAAFRNCGTNLVQNSCISAEQMTSTGGEEVSQSFSGHLLQNVKPVTLRTPAGSRFKKNNSEIVYGNDSFYLLFRLHQVLYERMHRAKLLSSSPENKWRIANDANPTDSYVRFKDALHNLLNRSSDNAKFEEECRAILGAQSYILFSLDKLIQKLIKQLQTIASEEMEDKLLQLYAYERSRNPGNFDDAVYHENARLFLPEDNLYRIECVPSPRRLTIQLMRNEHDKPKKGASDMDPTFAAYLNDELLSVVHQRDEIPGVFLKRNIRRFSTGDEISDTCKAMEEFVSYNGLQIVISCSSLKAAYVFGTEDLLYRRRRKTVYSQRVR